jgi:hypothetical protein
VTRPAHRAAGGVFATKDLTAIAPPPTFGWIVDLTGIGILAFAMHPERRFEA